MAQGISRVFSTNDQRPLQEKWQEANLQSIAVGAGQIPGPMSETALADAQVLIARLKKPRPWDAALAAAKSELTDTAHKYWQLFSEITDQQKRLEWLHKASTEHAIMQDITDEMLALPLAPQAMLNRLFGPSQCTSATSQYHLHLPEYANAPRLLCGCASRAEGSAGP